MSAGADLLVAGEWHDLPTLSALMGGATFGVALLLHRIAEFPELVVTIDRQGIRTNSPGLGSISWTEFREIRAVPATYGKFTPSRTRSIWSAARPDRGTGRKASRSRRCEISVCCRRQFSKRSIASSPPRCRSMTYPTPTSPSSTDRVSTLRTVETRMVAVARWT